MTIIDEQPQDARAKRKINPLFRLDGGPLPRGNPEAFPITLKNKKDQSNTWESRQQRSTPNASFACLFRWNYSNLDKIRCVAQRATKRGTLCHADKTAVFRPFCVARCGTFFPNDQFQTLPG